MKPTKPTTPRRRKIKSLPPEFSNTLVTPRFALVTEGSFALNRQFRYNGATPSAPHRR